PDADYFIDLRVPLSVLQATLGTGFSDDLRLALATELVFNIASDRALTDDLAGGDSQTALLLEDVLSDPLPLDADDDGLLLGEEEARGTDPDDADTDDDGLSDGEEIYTTETGPLQCDTDRDGLTDGQELGLIVGLPDTDTTAGCFVVDADPSTQTEPLLSDTDGGSVDDGAEDLDLDGAQDVWETDPNDPTDDVDADDDGIPDLLEAQCSLGSGDLDDADSDGVPDAIEGRRDSDGDGSPDFCDDDDDDDTIPTIEEGDADLDTDDDSTPDYLDPDSDNDGTDDITEGTGDVDCDDIRNFQDANDTDGPCGEGGPGGDTGDDDGTIYGFTGGSFTGGACSVLPASATLFPALAAFFGVSRRRRRRHGRKRLGVLALLLPTGASAQEVNAQLFQPSIDSWRFSALDDTVVGLDGYGGRLAVNYANDPFIYRYDNNSSEEVALLGRVTTTDLMAYGNLRRLRLGFDLPLHALTDGYELDEAGGRLIGDIALEAKGEVLDRMAGPLGLGGGLRVTLPTGNGTAFLGDSRPTAEGQITASTGEDLVAAANLGLRFAPGDNDQIFGDVTAGSRLTYGVGASMMIRDPLWVSAELTGQWLLQSSGATGSIPLEGLVTGHVAPLEDKRLIASLGAGAGLTSGLGAPDFRLVASVGWHPVRELADTTMTDVGDGTFDYVVTVTDADGLPQAAWLQVPSRDFNAQAGPDGSLRGTLPAGAHEIVITSDGYLRTTRVLQGDSDERISLEVVIIRPRVSIGEEKLELTERIFFELNSDVIKPDSHSLLDEVAQVLSDNPNIRLIEIQGHTDDQGTTEYNKELSQKRADAVRSYLIDQGGLSPRRLRATGYGEEYPRQVGTSSEARALNRRVEFVLLQVEP
ncbi:MAG: outer membrane protein OmpA-like peptidoglycan-associated protein, partial [Myxococcota bacterium]